MQPTTVELLRDILCEAEFLSEQAALTTREAFLKTLAESPRARKTFTGLVPVFAGESSTTVCAMVRGRRR